ncbi:MAG: SLC26A/SulP transporter family protein [Comamonadaceae bacterium]|nr:SLC26A/SulP transporter family protein [Comamonadaceae bacterium]
MKNSPEQGAGQFADGATPGVAPALSWANAGRDLTAALIVSLTAVSFYISSGTLMFQGVLAPHVPLVIGSALLGGAFLATVSAWRGSLPLASVGPSPATVPVLATITAGVAAQVSASAAMPTAIAALLITGLVIGLAWWVMGLRGGGDMIRYIPYPVIGGFLGSIGWMMLTGGMGVAVGQTFSLVEAWSWLAGQADARLATGIGLGVVIWWITLRVQHVLTLPGLTVVAALLVHAGLWLAGLDLATARQQGWLLASFTQPLPAWPWAADLLGAVQWAAVAQQSGAILSAVIVATLGTLLSDTSLEVAWDERADINRNLTVLGQGNVLVAALGGLPGGVSASRSLLNRACGAVSRRSGLMQAGFCLLAMGWGGPAMALVPRPLLGGLLIHLGIDMFKTWVLDSRRRLPGADYLTVLVMVGVTALLGFLPAVCVGVLVCCLDFAVLSARLSPIRRLVARAAWPSKVERSAAQTEFLLGTASRLRIMELQGVLFFGSTTLLVKEVEAMLVQTAPPEHLVLDFQHVRGVDSSAGQALGRLVKLARRHGVRVDFSHLSKPVRRALDVAGCLGAGGPSVYPDIDLAVSAWDDGQLARAQLVERSFEQRLAESLPSGTAVTQVMAYFEPLSLAPGDLLFTQGEAADAMYLVRSGRLVASVRLGQRSVSVREIHAGGVVGEMGLFRQTPRSATLRAEQACEVLRLHQGQLEALQRQHPELAAALYRLFLRQLAGRIDQLTAQANALSH